MSKTMPTLASGAATIEEIREVLIPAAKSDALGVEPPCAIVWNDHIMPTIVAIRQRAASKSATVPVTSIQRVARVFAADGFVVPAS